MYTILVAFPQSELAIVGESHGLRPEERSDSLKEEAVMWASVPKKRVSWEQRNLKKHGRYRMAKWCTPPRGIVTCLECGNWHKMETVCGLLIVDWSLKY